MNAQELRIGNLVCDLKNDIVVVETIHRDGINYVDGNVYGTEFDQIYPIPLTEEWLLNLGIEKTTEITYGAMWFRHPIQPIFVRVNKDGSVEVNHGYNNEQWLDHIKYVHQFQNICFDLTGEELKIN